MHYDFGARIERSGTHSVKWDKMMFISDAVPEGTIPLWVADMDFKAPQPVIDALHERVAHGIFGYTSYHYEAYFAAVVDWFQKRFQWTVAPEDIFMTGGVVDAIDRAIQLFTEPGEGVIIQEPVYHPFSATVRKRGRRVVNNALINEAGHYTMDFEHLERCAQAPKTTMLVLCSPHNPVGRVWTADELKTLADICFKNDVLIVSDEIHSDIVHPDVKHHPLSTVVSGDRVIMCTAPSKTFNIAGFHASNVVIEHPEMKTKWRRAYPSGLVHPLSAVAVEAAYTQGEEWLAQCNAYITANLEYAVSFFKTHLPEARCRVPEGTYLLWVDFRAYAARGIDLDDVLIQKARVLLDPGPKFGAAGEGFRRMNVGCPRSVLQEALERMEIAFQEVLV